MIPLNPKTDTASHLLWIDILRGLAALGVVLFHVRVDLWVGWNAIHTNPDAYSAAERLMAFAAAPFPFLGSGVMLFFLVSGFCIHYPNAGAAPAPDWKPYALRRFFRIYPPYAAAVLLTVMAERFTLAFGVAPASTGKKILETLCMVQNYGPDGGQMTANPALWSLPVEMELYLAYPLFYWMLRGFGPGPTLVVTGLVSLGCLAVVLRGGDWAMGNFGKYWIIWGLGAALAEWHRRAQLAAWRPWCWTATIVLASGAASARMAGVPEAIQHFLWAAAYALILWWGLTRPGGLGRLNPGLRRGLMFLGTISYSLYLVHFPFFRVWGAVWKAGAGGKPVLLLIPLAFVGLCLAFAYVFYRWIEAPSHRLARQLSS